MDVGRGEGRFSMHYLFLRVNIGECVCSVLLGHLFLLIYGTEVNVCAFLCVCLTNPGAEASACALLCVSDHSWC